MQKDNKVKLSGQITMLSKASEIINNELKMLNKELAVNKWIIWAPMSHLSGASGTGLFNTFREKAEKKLWGQRDLIIN